LKFALRCGVGNSVRTLRKRAGTMGRLFTDAGPDDLVRELADAVDSNVQGFHFFPFGGLKKTGAWLDATRAQCAAAAPNPA
jgi:methylenetetrahydrofolate reductase (NADPH)